MTGRCGHPVIGSPPSVAASSCSVPAGPRRAHHPLRMIWRPAAAPAAGRTSDTGANHPGRVIRAASPPDRLGTAVLELRGSTYMDPVERMRSAGKRLAEPVDSMAQTVAKRATELVVDSLDINAVLDRVDVERLLARVDVNELTERVDVNALVDRTELKTVLAKSSTTVVTQGIDLVRSQAVGLDDFMARWVNRILHRKRAPAAGPVRLVS